MRLFGRASLKEGGTQRHWGPFTGGQLTTIICVIVITTLFPVGAWALTTSNVVITDRGRVNQAIVDAAGDLSTKVTGSVSTRPANSTPFSFVLFAPSGGAYQLLFAPPAGKTTLAITSLTYANNNGSPQGSQVALFSGTNCNTFVKVLDESEAPANDTIVQSFPQPLVIAPGGSAWSVCAGATGNPAAITAVGYSY